MDTVKNTPEKRRGIFDKLLILHLYSTSILFLIIIVSYYHIEKNSFNNTLIKKSDLIHDLLEIACVDPTVNTIAYDRIDRAVKTLYKENRDIVYVEIYDPTAYIIASIGAPPKVHLSAEEINRLFKQNSDSGPHTNVNLDYSELITYLNVADHYLGLVRIGFTKKYLQKQLRGNILYFLGIFIIAIAVTSMIFYVFTNRWIVLPIINVSKIMKNYGQDELRTLFDKIKNYNKSITKDEIGIMSAAFERMISSIIKRTKEKEKAEERYRLIAENAADVIWTMDMDFNFTYISPSIYHQRGYTVEEAMAHSLDEVVSGSLEELLNLFGQKLVSIQAGDPEGWEPTIFEIEQYCKDGTTIWTHNNARILPGHDNQPISILGITRDITDRVMAEQALKESERKYRNIFESSMDAILLSGTEKSYMDCNPAALRLFGIESKKQLTQLTLVDFSPQYQPDGALSSEKANQMIREAMENGSNLFEWTHKRLNGEEFYASVLVTRVKMGRRTILQGTIRDISDYKRTQEIMVQSEKMMSVGGLAAGMAHEINNPLAGMLQTANVMENRLVRDIAIPANVKAAEAAGVTMEAIQKFMTARGVPRMLTTINESGQRIAAIVDNMLSFARKSEAQVSSHPLSELIDKTLELASTDFDLKKRYDFKMIEIKKEYDDRVPLVPCEAAKIQQVLLNIFRNGAQAMQETEIEKPCFIVRTQFDENQKMVCVEIKDNGPGMDEKTRKRVFEPFYTTKPVGVGTGLGLSVSYFIITENHGGVMCVESVRGSGAKFIIRLPSEGKLA